MNCIGISTSWNWFNFPNFKIKFWLKKDFYKSKAVLATGVLKTFWLSWGAGRTSSDCPGSLPGSHCTSGGPGGRCCGGERSSWEQSSGFTQLADHQLSELSSTGSGPELPRTWSCLEQEAGGHWDGEGGWAEEVRTSGEKDRWGLEETGEI